jgi:hypothetical protein
MTHTTYSKIELLLCIITIVQSRNGDYGEHTITDSNMEYNYPTYPSNVVPPTRPQSHLDSKKLRIFVSHAVATGSRYGTSHAGPYVRQESFVGQ